MFDVEIYKQHDDADHTLIDPSLDFKNPSQIHLSLCIGSDSIRWAFLDISRNKFMGFGSRRFDEISRAEQLGSKLEKLLETGVIPSVKFKNVTAVFENSRYTLVPEPLYDERKKDDYFHFNLGLAETNGSESIMSNHLENYALRIIFAVHGALHATLVKHFGEIRFFHQTTVQIDSMLAANKNKSEKQIIIFHRSENFDLLVCQGENLLFHNTFRCEEKEDLVFYILYVCEKLKLNTEQVPLLLYGEINKESDRYRMLCEYHNHVDFGSRSDRYQFSHVFDEIPGHYYPELFNQVMLV